MPPKRRRYEARVWNDEEAVQFLGAARSDRLYAAWLVALSCGLRRGELTRLRWRDLDLSRGTLSVATQRTTDTASSPRHPREPDAARSTWGAGSVSALRAHRQAQLAATADLHGLLLPVDHEGPEFVFVGNDLQPLHPQRLTDLFQRAAKAANVPVIRLHDARHSCATLARDTGAGLARHLTEQGVTVVEVSRPSRQVRRRYGKSDVVDAIAAARAVLSGEASATPKTHVGPVEALRALKVVQRSANKARTQALNQLHALVLTAPDELRERLRTLKTVELVRTCAGFRIAADDNSLTAIVRLALRELAQRIGQLQAQLKTVVARLHRIAKSTAPALGRVSEFMRARA